jgi:hypothetical protein
MTRISLHRELFASGRSIRKQFKEAFPELVARFLDSYLSAFEALKSFKRDKKSRRDATIEIFLLGAFNSLLVSTKLLYQGLLVPSGNMMRHLDESIALALLCSTTKLDVFDRIQRDPATFAFHDCIRLLSTDRARKYLGLEKSGLDKNRGIHKLYDRYSHATVFSMSPLYNYSKGNKPVLGAFYDGGKHFAYEKEMKLRCSACGYLENAIQVIKAISEREKHPAGAA